MKRGGNFNREIGLIYIKIMDSLELKFLILDIVILLDEFDTRCVIVEDRISEFEERLIECG